MNSISSRHGLIDIKIDDIMEYKTLRERIEEQAVSNNDLSQKKKLIKIWRIHCRF